MSKKRAYINVSIVLLEDWLKFSNNKIKILYLDQISENSFTILCEGDGLPNTCILDSKTPVFHVKPFYRKNYES